MGRYNSIVFPMKEDLKFLSKWSEEILRDIKSVNEKKSDGEILGTGIEISMDVTFTVSVIKGKQIAWPRGQNVEHIFTAGNVRPLDQAIQHATSEMLRWLTEDYDLSLPDANIILGTYVEYDVGNVFDPAYTMICKLPKSVLPEPSVGALVNAEVIS